MKELGQLPDCFLVKGCVPVKTALKILQSHDHSLIFSLICSFTFFFFYFVNGFFYSLISYFHLSHTLIPQLSFFFLSSPLPFLWLLVLLTLPLSWKENHSQNLKWRKMIQNILKYTLMFCSSFHLQVFKLLLNILLALRFKQVQNFILILSHLISSNIPEKNNDYMAISPRFVIRSEFVLFCQFLRVIISFSLYLPANDNVS